MTDEEAFFEVYWALLRQERWKKNNLDRGPNPTEEYMAGMKDNYREGWMARASLHVTPARSAHRTDTESVKP